MLLREYETVVLITPDISDELLNKIFQRIQSVLEQGGGTLAQVNNWGRRKLAYPIKKVTRAIYLHLVYVGDSKVVAEFERQLRIMEDVVRYMSLVLLDRAKPVEAKEFEPLKVINAVEKDAQMPEDFINDFALEGEDFEGIFAD